MTMNTAQNSQAFHAVFKTEKGWALACGHSFGSIEAAKTWIAANPMKTLGEVKIATRPPASVGYGFTPLNSADFVS